MVREYGRARWRLGLRLLHVRSVHGDRKGPRGKLRAKSARIGCPEAAAAACPQIIKTARSRASLRRPDRASASGLDAAHGRSGRLPAYDWLKGRERPGGRREVEPARRG